MRWREWLGVGERRWKKAPDEEVQPGKTLWDWLQLLIVPAILIGVSFAWSASQSRSDNKREDRRSQDATLQAYLDQMSSLMLKEKLLTSKKSDPVRAVARTVTLTTLRRLDGSRKGEVVRFLEEAGLIQNSGRRVRLAGADLRGADLQDAILAGADLSHADLTDANLTGANLQHVDLEGAKRAEPSYDDLGDADLSYANLTRADLTRAVLDGAALGEANLTDANLTDAFLVEADLSYADLTRADLTNAFLADAYLVFADFTDAIFVGADLTDANLTDAKLRRAKLKGAIGLPKGAP